MKKFLLCICMGISCAASLPAQTFFTPAPRPTPTQILILGSTHFGQPAFYKASPFTDIALPRQQKELADINAQLAAYAPDLILIEREPEVQAQTNDLYNAYVQGKLLLDTLENGRSEQYRFGFALARMLGHKQILGIDCYESVSSRILNKGDGAESFIAGLDSFSALGRRLDAALKTGDLSLKNYLLQINSPGILHFTYQSMMANSLRVRNGQFTGADPAYVDTTQINETYIGAEYAALFARREFKIYSNVVAAQQKHQARRILIIIGQRHAAFLPRLMMHDPAFALVPLSVVLK